MKVSKEQILNKSLYVVKSLYINILSKKIFLVTVGVISIVGSLFLLIRNFFNLLPSKLVKILIRPFIMENKIIFLNKFKVAKFLLKKDPKIFYENIEKFDIEKDSIVGKKVKSAFHKYFEEAKEKGDKNFIMMFINHLMESCIQDLINNINGFEIFEVIDEEIIDISEKMLEYDDLLFMETFDKWNLNDQKKLDILKLIIEKDINLFLDNIDNISLYILDLKSVYKIDIFKLIIEKDVNLFVENIDNISLYILAIEPAYKIEILKLIIEKDVNLFVNNMTNIFYYIFFINYFNKATIFKLVIEKDVNLFISNIEKFEILDLEIPQIEEVFIFLIEKSKGIKRKDLRNNRCDLIKELINVDINLFKKCVGILNIYKFNDKELIYIFNLLIEKDLKLFASIIDLENYFESDEITFYLIKKILGEQKEYNENNKKLLKEYLKKLCNNVLFL